MSEHRQYRVQSGRMKAEHAEHEIACMQAVIDTLKTHLTEKPQP